MFKHIITAYYLNNNDIFNLKVLAIAHDTLPNYAGAGNIKPKVKIKYLKK